MPKTAELRFIGHTERGRFDHFEAKIRYLDPDFEVWVFLTIDTILLGMYREQKEATAEKLRAEQALEMKKRELLQKFPEFQEFLELEGRVSEAEKRRIKSIKESIKQLKFDLFPA